MARDPELERWARRLSQMPWLSHPSEKYEFVNWGDEILNIWKNNPVMFQSPATSYSFHRFHAMAFMLID